MFEDVLGRVSDDSQKIYLAIIQSAIDLGYKVRKDKINSPSYSFFSSKFRQTILRVTDNGKETKLRLKFYGVKQYSKRLEGALKETIEEYHFRYTGCYNCGKCDTKPLGYTIIYEDGQEHFRCGHELVEIQDLDHELGMEIVRLIYEQTDYWRKRQDLV